MSIAWILGSLILVAGGFMLSSIGFALAQVDSPYLLLAFWGLGAFIGGFAAARASKGKTIAEPAIGAVLFLGAIIAVFAATSLGGMLLEFLLQEHGDEMVKTIAMLAGAFLVGGILGAYAGEKAQDRGGEIGQGFAILVAFLMVMGGLFIGMFALAMLSLESSEEPPPELVLLVCAVGCVIAGFASRRAHAKVIPTMIGAVLNGALLIAFMLRIAAEDADTMTGAIVFGVGMVVCAGIGAALGKIALAEGD